MARIELKIAGYGGQGVITLSKFIATAALLYEDKEVVQTEAYGAQARGGACWAEVVISEDEEIDYPRAIEPDYLVVLSQAAAGMYRNALKNDGVAFLDPLTVTNFKPKSTQTVYEIPAQKIAKDEFNMPVVANVIYFAVISTLTNLITLDSAKKIIETMTPKKHRDVNLKAFERGVELAKSIKPKTN